MMDHLRRTLSLGSRRKREGKDGGAGTGAGAGSTGTTGKPLAWQDDERKVREGTCSFQVKYLGSIEVFESRGMEVCEDAGKILRSQSRSKHQCVVLYVSADALRVVDEISKGLIVDQTIEKVSFCAPDRNHEKGFAYICRDGTTRRWLCHGFLARKESGERLSHAVGCAFAVCLERKQKREREAVQVTYSDDRTAFTRIGSFRQTTLIERMIDPQAAIVAEPLAASATAAAVPADSCRRQAVATTVDPATARERPLTNPDTFARIGSFREFPKLAGSTSPFKRQLSLRLNAQPAGVEPQRQYGGAQPVEQAAAAAARPVMPPGGAFSSSHDSSSFEPPVSQRSGFADPISAMCQQLTSELSTLTTNERRAPAASVAHLLPGNESQIRQGLTGTEAAFPPLSSAAANGLYARSGTPPAGATSMPPATDSWRHSAALQSGTNRQWLAASSLPGTPASHSSINPPAVPERRANGGSETGRNQPSAGSLGSVAVGAEPLDPFDAAWALRAAASTATNPFLMHREPLRQQRQPLPQPSAVTALRGFEPTSPAFVVKL